MARGQLYHRAQPALHKFTVRQIERDELGRLLEPRDKSTPSIGKIRDSHHMAARLLAAGLRVGEVAERTGYTPASITRFQNVPAFQELMAHYRAIADDAYAKVQDQYQTASVANMLAAERHIADHIAELDETGELLPIKTALAISADKADRFGYGKKTTNLNVNVDFAKNLEGMIRRSGKTIDVTPGARPTGQAGSPGVMLTEAQSFPPQVPPVAGPPTIRPEPPQTREEYRKMRRI